MIELSLALGKTLDEIRDMPMSDFNLYRLYYEKQPFGQWRQDYHAAQIAHMLAAVNSKRAPDIEKFMPFWYDDEVDGEEVFEALFAGAVTL